MSEPTRQPIELHILPQPDDTTCGPTCLHAVYAYWGDHVDLNQLVEEIVPLREGGTLAVALACHALRRGYDAEIHTYNLQLFDPTWFADGVDIAQRLAAQLRHKHDHRIRRATELYLEFLALGGRVSFEDLDSTLIRGYLHRGIPILTGLSATYLYRCARERNDTYDSERGEPVGHFVVLGGYDPERRRVSIADPSHDNPRFGSNYYEMSMERLITSIALGIMTHDANLLIVQPRRDATVEESS